MVYNSLYCWMLQKEQIVHLVLWLQPYAVISRSPWYLVCSLMWGFGQVKSTLQQIWSSEGKEQLHENVLISICCCSLVETWLSTTASLVGVGNSHRRGMASSEIHSSCIMSRLSVRHSHCLGNEVRQCQQFWEAAERVTMGRCTYLYKETICVAGY